MLSSMTQSLGLLFLSFAAPSLASNAFDPGWTPPSQMQPAAINCQGSGMCGHGAVKDLTQDLPSLNNNSLYAPGQTIWCEEHYCLMLRGNQDSFFVYSSATTNQTAVGLSGADIKTLVQKLQQYGCKGCGSINIAKLGNPAAPGWLTLNYVGEENDRTFLLPDITADNTTNPLVQGDVISTVIPKTSATGMRNAYGGDIPIFSIEAIRAKLATPATS